MTEPPSAFCGRPTRLSGDPQRLSAEVAVLEISAIVPTQATIAEGGTALPDADSLYRLTFPETNGTPSSRPACARPSTAATNCAKCSGRCGFPKFRQSVKPAGRAPTATTLRTDSQTASSAARRASSFP